MCAYDYCRDKVALPGSSLYYSVLFVAPALREALTAVHAAAEEFRDAAGGSSDEGMARARLGWWAEEMQRTFEGAPRHPVTRLLLQPLRDARIDAGRFQRVLIAFAEHHGRGSGATVSELDRHCERIAELTGVVAAELCGYHDPATLEASRHLGAGLELVEVARGGQGVAVGAVAECARERLERALAEMPKDDHASQQCRRALAEMTLANIRAMQRGGYDARSRARAATPLRKLWIAWKHRR